MAANAAAEAVIVARCRKGLPGLAVQWGPIGDAGYLTREGTVADLLSKRLGERLMTAAEALAGLPTLIASGLPVVGTGTDALGPDGGWASLAANADVRRGARRSSRERRGDRPCRHPGGLHAGGGTGAAGRHAGR